MLQHYYIKFLHAFRYGNAVFKVFKSCGNVELCVFIKIKYAELYIYIFNHRAMDVNMGLG